METYFTLQVCLDIPSACNGDIHFITNIEYPA
jgi:hypothetical protein